MISIKHTISSRIPTIPSVLVVGSCLGVLGMCASELSAELSQPQRHCQRAQTHDTATLSSGSGECFPRDGRTLIAEAEYDRAIAACESAAAGLPQSPSPLICLGDAYRHKGELEQALNYLEQARSLTSSGQNHQSVTVSSFYQHGDLQSIELLQEY